VPRSGTALDYAAELEELSANPLDRVKWKPPKVAEVMDRRVVINPGQARQTFSAATYVGRPWRGRHLRAFFACMYFAALRPGEVKALRKDGCYLPASGWGRLTLSSSRPQSNRRWTDSGGGYDDRGLKYRADDDTRLVPIPPELVMIKDRRIGRPRPAPDSCMSTSRAALPSRQGSRTRGTGSGRGTATPAGHARLSCFI
jgi:hypothetical protein